MVRCADNKYLVVFVKSVHFREYLVDGGSAAAVFLVEASAFGEQRVDFVDEYDARLVVARLLEQLTHSLRSHAYEHLVEMRPSAVDK